APTPEPTRLPYTTLFRSGHRTQCGLVQHVIHPLAGPGTILRVTDVALDKLKPRPLLCRHQAANLIQVALITGGEVVQPYHALVRSEEHTSELQSRENLVC